MHRRVQSEADNVRRLRDERGEPGSDAGSQAQRAAEDAALVVGVRARDRNAVAHLFERHGARVRRVLRSVLGPSESEIEDLVHEVFVRALENIGSLERHDRLENWLVGIAVFVAREFIRRRTRSRFFPLFADVPEPEVNRVPEHVTEAVRDTFSVLDKLPADERIVFSLRFIEGLDLAAVALVCDVSLSTTKRRLRDAETRFRGAARAFSSLAPFLEEREEQPCRR